MVKKKNFLKRIILIIVSIVLFMFAGFYIYTLDYYHALPIAPETLSDNNIEYSQEKNMVVISPGDNKNNKGIIFYPGGKVEYLSYIPLMEKLSEEGYTCFLMKMPFNLAVFDQNAAERPISEYKDMNSWYLSGHSLGGAMASIYTSKNLDKVKGLILLGAYPSADLSESNIDMISIYGSEDNILSKDTFEKNKSNGPINSKYVEIKGGNHAYYGNYGEQKNDGIATITTEEQQNFTVEKIVEFIGN